LEVLATGVVPLTADPVPPLTRDLLTIYYYYWIETELPRISFAYLLVCFVEVTPLKLIGILPPAALSIPLPLPTTPPYIYKACAACGLVIVPPREEAARALELREFA